MKNKANPARTLSQEHPDRSGSSVSDSLESKHSVKQELSLHRLVYKWQQTQPRNGMSSLTAHEEGSFSETNAAMISSGIFSCSLQAGIGPIPGGSVGVIRTEVIAKSPARCRLSHWTVDSPGGTERAASPPCCCFCFDSWAFARGACCNSRDLLSFPANSVCHSLRLLHPRSRRRIKCIVGPTMAASIPDGQCSLTRVTARDTTLTIRYYK